MDIDNMENSMKLQEIYSMPMKKIKILNKVHIFCYIMCMNISLWNKKRDKNKKTKDEVQEA
jgi:hypothetical protein